MDRALTMAGRLALLGATGVAAGVSLPWAATWWLSRGRILGAEQARACEPGDLPPVAVVLGAQVFADGRPSRFLRARLQLGAELYRAGLVSTLIVSGAGGARHHDEPEAMRDWLLGAGIPLADIVLDGRGYDTYDSSLRARDHFGHRRLTIVSQRFHLGRAVAICRVLGIDAVGVGDETVRGQGRWRYYVLRERFAALKAVWDLASRRPPHQPANPATGSVT